MWIGLLNNFEDLKPMAATQQSMVAKLHMKSVRKAYDHELRLDMRKMLGEACDQESRLDGRKT